MKLLHNPNTNRIKRLNTNGWDSIVRMRGSLCPYHWEPCIKEQCMAWSGKQDLEELKKNNAEGFESLVSVLMIQEGYSRNAALDVIEIRNNNERCKLIYPDQPI